MIEIVYYAAFMVVFCVGIIAINKWGERKMKRINEASDIRAKVMHTIFKHPNWRELSEDFDDVSFKDFVNEYENGRDPMKLMSPRIQHVMAEREAKRAKLPDNVVHLN